MHSATPGRLRFNTDALAQRDRFPAFCEEMVRRYAALDIIERSGDRGFRASIDLQQVGTIGVGHIATTPSDYFRSPQLVHDGDDALCIVLCLAGGAYQTQRQEDQGVRAGQGVVCDSGYVGGIYVTAESQFWSLKIPRRRITSLLPGVARYAGAKLDRDPLASQLLFGYLETGRALDLGAGGAAVAMYDEHVIDLIALTLGAEGESRHVAEVRGARAARREAILREIGRRSSDPGLSAAAIGAKLGVTPRYVHLLLEETGKSFTHHLLERRLDGAAALLRDPSWRDRRIADIALATGFTDLSYFNRSFRRRYGATPSDVRNSRSARQTRYGPK